MSESEYQECDAFILVRYVSYAVTRKGFRVKRIILAPTMLDAAKDIAQDSLTSTAEGGKLSLISEV